MDSNLRDHDIWRRISYSSPPTIYTYQCVAAILSFLYISWRICSRTWPVKCIVYIIFVTYVCPAQPRSLVCTTISSKPKALEAGGAFSLLSTQCFVRKVLDNSQSCHYRDGIVVITLQSVQPTGLPRHTFTYPQPILGHDSNCRKDVSPSIRSLEAR